MRIVLTGASGQLGAHLIEQLRMAGHQVRAWSGAQTGQRGTLPLEPIDLTAHEVVSEALRAANPDAVLHAAAVATAREVFEQPERARAVNVEATRRIADWCREQDRRMLYVSTDMVFDGRKGWYTEMDLPQPILAYGRSKLAAEPAVSSLPHGLVARVSLMYGPSLCGKPAFFEQAIASLRRNESRAYFVDEFRTPLHFKTAAEILVRLLESGVTGIIHVGGPERLSRFELMRRSAMALGIDPSLVLENRQAEVPLEEPRPADLSLDTTRLTACLPGLVRPGVEEVLARP